MNTTDNATSSWRPFFKSFDQMEQGGIHFLVQGFLPEGIVALGGLSGSAKTWLSLSIAKGLLYGKKVLGIFDVPRAWPVIYLIPEAGERSFRDRLDKMGIRGEGFLCRTLTEGDTNLQDEYLLDAVRDLKPVIFLDTAIRFSPNDENSASDHAKGLAKEMFALRAAGSPLLIGIHHSPKSVAGFGLTRGGHPKSGEPPRMTFENTLRGSGDIGAICDAVYGVRMVNDRTTEVQVQCVKARDFEKLDDFRIAGRPYIDQTGNFSMLEKPAEILAQDAVHKLVNEIENDPRVTYDTLTSVTGIAKGRIRVVAADHGWQKVGDTWQTKPSHVSY